MRAAWWWIDRWRKSTAYTDMTMAQQGAYRNLLDELWLRAGVLPADDRILAKISGDALEWPNVREAVLARFVLTSEGYRNTTHDEVFAGTQAFIERQRSKGEARAASASRGPAGTFQPRQPEVQPADQPESSRSTSRTTSLPSPSPSPSPSPYPDQSPSPKRKRTTRPSAAPIDRPDAREVIDDYNVTTGSHIGYQGNVDFAVKALDGGITPETIHGVFEAVRDRSTPAAKWWAEEHKGFDWLMRTTYKRRDDGQIMQGGLIKIPNELAGGRALMIVPNHAGPTPKEQKHRDVLTASMGSSLKGDGTLGGGV